MKASRLGAMLSLASLQPVKRSHFLLAIAAALLLALAGLVAYAEGLWIPNFPSKADFPVRGLDVSRHQGAIQWPLVPADEFRFVYIKATEGGDHRDARFGENWQGSAAAGLRRGAYHFFTMRTPGLQQAANFLTVVPDDPETLPPAVDLEFGGNSSARPSVADFRRELELFLATVRQARRREPVIYTTMEFRDQYLRDFTAPRLWIRSVFTKPSLPEGEPWLLWQFSGRTRVRGIAGFVDQNVFRGSHAQFESFASGRD